MRLRRSGLAEYPAAPLEDMLSTGNRPEDVTIPNRVLEFTTSKGPIDGVSLAGLKDQYAKAIRALSAPRAADDRSAREPER
jgi:hypothetical protein